MNPQDRHIVLFLLGIGFLSGGLTGHWMAEHYFLQEETVAGFLQAVKEDSLTEHTLVSEVWSVLRWPLFVLILGFFPLAGLTIPLLFFLRGFLLSYLISGFGLYGIGGVLQAGFLLGPTMLLSIPAFFILGSLILMHRAGSKTPTPWAAFFLCLGLLSLCIFLNVTAVPILLKKFLLRS